MAAGNFRAITKSRDITPLKHNIPGIYSSDIILRSLGIQSPT